MDDLPLGPRLKIERAQHHINDLNGQVGAYLAERPMKLVVRMERNPPTKTLLVEIEKPIPAELALLIGDAVHNLRSALDLFAFHLIGHLGASEQGVHFPFAWKPENTRQTIRSRQIHLAGEHVADAVADLDFYLGGNPLLSGLHLLDIADKHKLIVPVGRAAKFSADDLHANMPDYPVAGPGILHFTGQDKELLGISYATAPRHQRRGIRNFTADAEVQPAFEICFGPDTAFAGDEVVTRLKSVTNEVVRAIRHVMSAKPVS